MYGLYNNRGELIYGGETLQDSIDAVASGAKRPSDCEFLCINGDIRCKRKDEGGAIYRVKKFTEDGRREPFTDKELDDFVANYVDVTYVIFDESTSDVFSHSEWLEGCMEATVNECEYYQDADPCEITINEGWIEVAGEGEIYAIGKFHDSDRSDNGQLPFTKVELDIVKKYQEEQLLKTAQRMEGQEISGPCR